MSKDDVFVDDDLCGEQTQAAKDGETCQIGDQNAENCDDMPKNGENCAETTQNGDEPSLSAQTFSCPAPDEQGKGILFDYSQNKPSKGKKVANIAKKIGKRYFIDAFTGMAQGLFCTLIAGTILAQIASWCGKNNFAVVLDYMASLAKFLMGAGIGVGIAHKLGAKPLVIFSAAVTGMIGAFSAQMITALADGGRFLLAVGTSSADASSALSAGGIQLLLASPGNPIGAYIVSVLTVEIASLYAGKTKLDIVLVPLGMAALAFIGMFAAWPFIKLIDLFAKAIVLLIDAGAAVKVLTGIVVAVVMGILLTMPTSSAAIWVAIATSAVALENPEAFAIAGGAAVAGCSAHMIGFAVATVRENRVSGLISQGVGTSMLQIPNIMKKPIIMLPEIVASAFAGLAAVLMGLRCDAAGGGMGTSGLVGVFRAIDVTLAAGEPQWKVALGVCLCLFIIPAVISFLVDLLLRKFGKIRPDDVLLKD